MSGFYADGVNQQIFDEAFDHLDDPHDDREACDDREEEEDLRVRQFPERRS
jgi:hypothetical protein